MPRYYPEIERFQKLAEGGARVPVYRQLLADTLTPVAAFRKVEGPDYAFLLESVVGGERIAQYSFVGSKPFAVFVARRDRGHKDKYSQTRGEFVATIVSCLDDIQAGMLARAKAFRKANTRRIDTRDEFYDFFGGAGGTDESDSAGGFALCHWSGESAVEEQVKNDLSVSIRCIPQDAEDEVGQCVISGKPSRRRVVFAKGY